MANSSPSVQRTLLRFRGELKFCHSCEPNKGIIDRTEFVAFKNIKVGDEITIDYAMLGYEYGDELPLSRRACKYFVQNSVLHKG